MKKNILIVLIIGLANIFAQSPVDKISSNLKLAFEQNKSSDKQLIWIYFSDKGNDSQSYIDNPQSFLSKESLKRRNKLSDKNSLIDFTDLPVCDQYINEIKSLGFELKQKSKWFNAISGFADQATVNSISSLDFVRNLDVVKKYKKRKDDIEFSTQESVKDNTLSKETNVHTYDYGTSYSQLALSNIPQVHDSGYNGQGINICVMDAGFNNLSHEVFQDMNIIAMWDFVNNDSNVADQSDSGDGTHGTAVLSIIGGFKEGQLIGPAFGANFILAKTENTESETPIEEDNWIAAMEWADSIGVDVTSTSLGYLDFDLPYVSYTWEDMNGNTALITKAADLAVAKGIVVVNSAGNEGYSSIHNTLVAPADGDSVIAVGAVDFSGNRVYFSSVGPTSDGRIKPDVMAVGNNVYHASPVGDLYSTGGGTSYSCPITAGVAAILLSANNSLTPIQIREIFRNTSSNSNDPNNLMGWGVVNALAAFNNAVSNINDDEIVDSYYILANYPNPFNPSTTIIFSIPTSSFVKIDLYNILGDKIKSLFKGVSKTEEIKLDASNMASGVYFVTMITDKIQKTLKISLIK